MIPPRLNALVGIPVKSVRSASVSLGFQGEREDIETVRISDAPSSTSPDGTVYGVELLNANEQLQASDNGALVVVNEAIGARQEVRLFD